MKCVKRQRIFETNSSSVHVIAISTDGYGRLPSNLKFKLGEFGWENRRLDTDFERASYLWTAIVYKCRKWDSLKSTDEIPEAQEAKNFIKDTLERVDVEAEFEEPTNDDYYIDHGVSELSDFLEDVLQDEDRLLRYLFSGQSVVVTGNDNSDETPDSYDFDSNDFEVYEKGN